eukprot:TRINITY_DN3456_c0_g1_i7.p1 TRINITY_DN3456_c0_g1~~TRINITY_DN3456_c0_g1_i7.p1  ORF type:complete len:223 (-),score=78.21 TRINITY_DN3456_c0_g1_i7:71-739(-)
MNSEDIRAPVLWRRPHAKIYSYNQELGGNYYQPMIDYVEAKDRQGVFFEKPSERIHLPLPSEQCMKKHEPSKDYVSGVYSLDRCLVKAYSQQTKEMNGSTAKTRGKMLNTVTCRKHLPHTLLDNQQTHYDSVRLLKGSAPGQKQATYYSTELGVVKNSKLFSAKCQSDHLLDVLQGQFDFHQNNSGMGGITSDQMFYDPEKIKDYTGAIRFKDPQRTVPVLA